MKLLNDKKIFDLNISENYVRNWGAWEVGREVISNAIDADPEGYSVEYIDDNIVRVFTRTYPTLSQIKVIGFGTKSDDSDTIGKFGEGIKLAALVAARLGGKLTVLTPKYLADFVLVQQIEGEPRILAIEYSESNAMAEGCDIYISTPGIREAVKGKIIKGAEIGFIEKTSESHVNFYVKGIWVHSVEQEHLFDWNIEDCEIGRDRNLINVYQLYMKIVYFLNRTMTAELAKKLVNAKRGTFELEALKNYAHHLGDKARNMVVAAVHDKFGVDVVLATDDAAINKMAAMRGKTVLVLDEGIVSVVEEKIQKAEQVIPKDARFVQAAINPTWAPAIEELNKLSDLLEIATELFVFEDCGDGLLGMAVLKPGTRMCTVWISNSLFLPGKRRERLSTYLHELGHIRNKSGDGTIEFEKSLDTIAGLIALAWLDKK